MNSEMKRPRCFLLLALLAATPLLASAGTTASFRTGSVVASRMPAAEHRLAARNGGLHARMLLTPESAQLQLWVLGLPTDQQVDVYATLKAVGGEILHALPDVDHHWLVHAPHADAIQSIMDKHADVTAALFPDAFKLSPLVLLLVETYEKIKNCLLPTPEAGTLPANLQFIQHNSTQGGNLQVVLTAKAMGVPQQRMKELAATSEQKLKWILYNVGSMCAPSIYSSMQTLNVVLCPEDVETAASWLASQPQVTWVDMKLTMQPLDMYSITKMQAASVLPNASWPAPDVLLGNATANPYTPYWAVGLDGTGQVAGVVDTGIDYDSCYVFNTSQNDYQNGQHTFFAPITNDENVVLNNVTYYQNLASEKIVAYIFGMNNIDDTEGHGTHVSTSILGSREGVDPRITPDIATGVAPKARVAVFDAGTTDPTTGDTIFEFPAWMSSFYRIFGSLNLLGGAYIINNSWGNSGDVTYTNANCEEIDGLMFQNTDMLLVFAAGNDGDNLTQIGTTGTVSPPATCKNVLSVGAAESYQWKSQVYLPPYNLVQNGSMVTLPPSDFGGPRQLGNLTFATDQEYIILDSTYAEFTIYSGFDSNVRVLGNTTYQVYLASPVDACGPLDTSGWPTSTSARITLFVFRTSNCDISVALANMFADQRVVGVFMTAGDTTGASGYDGRALAIIQDTFTDNWLLNNLGNGITISAAWTPPSPTDVVPSENTAYFSSYGSPKAFTPPASGPRSLYYRIKPEVIAPGSILAAKSDGKFSAVEDQCSVQEFQGTSMATPQVTGAAILARQYFMDGFYPTGAKVANNSFTPSGPLLKAVIVAGTTAMKGISASSFKPLAPPPSQFQGFGQVSLMNSLPLAGDKLGWRLQVVNLTNLNVQGTKQTYAVNVSASDAGKPLIVVLTWYDLPAFEGAAASGVNNLDLVVTGPGPSIWYPNGLQSPDLVNNVEKVYIPAAVAGSYLVNVTATYLSVASSPQPFSLVVLGAVSNNLVTSQAEGQKELPPEDK